jgi:hypothetical protein
VGKAGAELVADVVPFEEMKLRMLMVAIRSSLISAIWPVISISTTVWDDNYRRAAPH